MFLFSLQSFFFFILSLLFIFLYIHFLTPKTKPNKKVCFKIYPLIGSLPDLLKNRHRILDWTTQVLSDSTTNTAVFTRPGTVQVVLTANPKNIEHMVKTKFENYPKGERFINILEDFLGKGIFNSDGNLWKLQRKIASHEFSTKSLKNFVMESVTNQIQTKLIPILHSKDNQVLDLQDLFERFGFDNMCKIAFNYDSGCLAGNATVGAEFMRAFNDASVLSSRRFMCIVYLMWKIKRFLNIGTERKLRDSIATAHKFADEIIRSRIEGAGLEKGRESMPVGPAKDEDLLSRFIGTENASPEFLRDIVISFILAGQDSTSSALSWFFWNVSSRNDVKEKIIEEIRKVRMRIGNETTAFGYEDLKEMQYLHAVIMETMRLYPPVPMNTKTCLNDDVLPDGTRVGKGWFVTFHTYAMGRMESVWGKDCREFRPERWLENGVCRNESPFRFFVFHAGPRICLGKEMAYIQMKSIIASVMERFEIDALDKDTCPDVVFSFSLRMKNGLLVGVKERDVKCVFPTCV